MTIDTITRPPATKQLSPVIFDIDRVNLHYGAFHALKDITMRIAKGDVTALIGPSGCGKSTLLKSLNRMNDLIPGTRMSGELTLGAADITAPGLDVTLLRRRVGMVFQKPNPFPKTVFENVAYGLKINGEHSKALIAEQVEKSLIRAALWDEIKDRLHSSALGLSGGQQQRLCIARALAVSPDVLLMDEPASALDPRVSDRTAFFYLGRLIETGATEQIFTRPADKQTEDYITGRFG